MSCACHVTRRLDCLRRLVVVLTEQKKVRELCQFNYSGMEKEVWFIGGSCDCHVTVVRFRLKR